MPQTYMRTWPAISGLNSSLRPVSDLCGLRMASNSFASRLRRHQFQKRCKFGPVCLARKRDAQRHEQLRALATGAFLQDARQYFKVAVRLGQRVGRGGEELGSCGG